MPALPLIGFFALWAVIVEVGFTAAQALVIILIAAVAIGITAASMRSKQRSDKLTPSPAKSGSTQRQPKGSSPNKGVGSAPTRPWAPAKMSSGSLSTDQIDDALQGLPASVLGRSGSVFYSGREAFTGAKSLYLLGLNPGGNPLAQSGETIARDIARFRELTRPWSAYADESWQGAVPGTWGLQPRVLHMLRLLGHDPRLTPASNVVFVRSATEAALQADKVALLNLCWPVHQAVIDTLGVRVIVCFGGTAGKWVREKVNASKLLDSFRETNARGWKSDAHAAASGRVVVTVTHPGRADWRNPAADPTPLVARALARN